MPQNNGTETDSPTTDAMKAALDAKRDVLADMSASEVIANPGLDPFAAAGVVLGSRERIEKHRDDIVAQFGAEGAAKLDDLPVVALATRQAHIEMAATDPASDLSALHAELLEDHELLVTNADALASRKLLDRARVDRGRPIQGYLTTVQSTLILVTLLREQWATIGEKSLVTTEDLDRAERRAQSLAHRIDQREQGTTRLPAAETRDRALTMLIKTYSEVRRMLTYVRWHAEDAEVIAPSLYTSRRSKARAANGETLTPVQPVAPAPANDGGPFTS